MSLEKLKGRNFQVASLIVIFLFLITSAEATLTISPNPISIETKISETRYFTATFTNTFNFPIRDFSFTNLSGFAFPQINLAVNESRVINFSVIRNYPESSNIQSTVRFNYLVDVPSEPQTFEINITPTNFVPNFIVIHEGDTVRWRNTDTITHIVYWSSGNEITIPANGTAERIFSQTGTINYQDLVLFFGGTIEILNRTSQQAVHNPNYDILWNINLNVLAEPTVLLFESVDTTNFTIEALGVSEGLLKIKNTGNQTAQIVTLSSSRNWILFDENNFNLAPNQQKFIDFTISPAILNTNDTNKSYEIILKAKALNTNESNFTIIVFVPFRDFESGESDVESELRRLELFCQRNPTLLFCNNTIASGNQTIIIRDPEIQGNLSWSQVLDMLRRQRQSEDAQDRIANRLSSIDEAFNTQFPEYRRLLNESLSRQMENEKKAESASITRWIIGFFLIIISIIGYVGYRYRRYNAKRKTAEGWG